MSYLPATKLEEVHPQQVDHSALSQEQKEPLVTYELRSFKMDTLAHRSTEILQSLKDQHRLLQQHGIEVTDLSMVNPDLAPPRILLDRLMESVNKGGNHRYAVARGVRKLREAFCEKYRNAFQVSLDPEDEVCVTLGSKDGVYHALRVIVSPGDAVIVAAPSYPAHLSAVSLVGGTSIPWIVPTRSEFEEDKNSVLSALATLLQNSKARLVILNFPSNPTGLGTSSVVLKAICEVARRYNAYVLNDFVYGEMTFSKDVAPSLLKAAEGEITGLLEVYSLSKAYNVPGWRVGAILGDRKIVREVARQKSVADYGLFLPLQQAAAVALNCKDSITQPTVDIYQRRIRVLTSALKNAGWSVVQPEAGASLWASIPQKLIERIDAIRDSESNPLITQSISATVAELLLRQSGVLVTPGLVFGEQFDSFIRFAAVHSEEKLRDAAKAVGEL